MNSKENIPLDLEASLKLSEKIAKEKSPKAKFILDHTIDKKIRRYLDLSFAYLRWVDDFVDNPDIAAAKKQPFIERQLSLLDSIIRENENANVYKEESFLFHFVEFAKQRHTDFLIIAVKNMLDTIEMDVQRFNGDGIFSEAELKTYINKQAKALYDILLFFFLPEKYDKINNPPGRFHTKALIMRDLFEDIDVGLINISREDIEQFQLDIDSIKNKINLNPWIEEQFNNLYLLLIEEACEVKSLPFKYKSLIFFSQAYYLAIIIRLKASGLNSEKFNIHHNSFQKVKIYMKAFILIIKVFRIEFLK